MLKIIKIFFSDTSSRSAQRSAIVTNYLSKEVKSTTLSHSTAKDLLHSPTRSLLSSRKPQPISVKALMQNFEKFGSSPPPLPQKPMISKPHVPTKNVKNEIQKAENKISVSTENIAKSDVLTEIRPKPRLSRISIPLEVRKSEDNLANARLSEKLNTETVILKLNNAESILGISITGGVDENSDIVVMFSTNYLNIIFIWNELGF